MDDQPVIAVKDETDMNEMDELRDRREQRKEEWGKQFDKWLIGCATKRSIVEIQLATRYESLTKDGNKVTCTVVRVDEDFIQVLSDGVETWIRKQYIVGCRRVVAKASDPLPNT